MRRLIAAATVLTMTAAPLLAQGVGEMDEAGLIRSGDIIGGSVYSTAEGYGEGAWPGIDFEEEGVDWNRIGEIEDIVLNSSGEMAGVVAEIGGVLDIGDKHVLLQLGDVHLVPAEGRGHSVVTRFSEDELRAMQGVDEGWWEN